LSFKTILNKTQDLFDYILKKDKKLIIFAGASSSGKSYLAKTLKDYLEKKNKKVILISSDNFYKDLTTLFAYLYGTFDHPNLIDFKELNLCIDKLLNKKDVKIPIYSFEDHMRIGFEYIKADYDFLIVEGLYTLEFMKKEFLKKALKIFVHSNKGELILRRLLRDPQRTKESLEKILSKLINVFPMWNVFGEKQRSLADIIFINDYEIIKDKGDAFLESYIPAKNLSQILSEYKLEKKEFVIEYYYRDENKDILCIKEHYLNGKFYKVSLSKRDIISFKQPLKVKSYSVSFKEPGMFSQIHILMQLADLKHIFLLKKDIEIYKKEEKMLVLEKFKYKYSNKLKILEKL